MWDKMVSRSEKRLSAKAVAAFRDAGRYADGGGLYLIVGENQRKAGSFAFKWTADGATLVLVALARSRWLMRVRRPPSYELNL